MKIERILWLLMPIVVLILGVAGLATYEVYMDATKETRRCI